MKSISNFDSWERYRCERRVSQARRLVGSRAGTTLPEEKLHFGVHTGPLEQLVQTLLGSHYALMSFMSDVQQLAAKNLQHDDPLAPED